jgi:predicted RND superfamily exporter protein
MVIESAKGYDKNQAARRAFRQNYLPGLTALVTDIFGFATMALIPIGAIQELAIVASEGILVIILTKIVLLPILLSYTGITAGGARHMKKKMEADSIFWSFFAKFTEAPWAAAAIIVCAAAGGYGWVKAKEIRIGDVTVGSSELLPDSVYNQDIRYVIDNYSMTSDIFVVMVETGEQECTKYKNVEAMDRLEWVLKNTKGVQAVFSPAFVTRQVNAAFAEGHVKWQSLMRNQKTIDTASGQMAEQGMINASCNFAMVPAFLKDHKAETLDRVVHTVEKFAEENNSGKLKFLLATGQAGIAAAVNQEIKAAELQMMILVYAVIAVLVFVTYRSIRVLICIMAPLYLTSILCEALMVYLGIGVKVATLPVIALGVGVGVDYAIYLYSRLDQFFHEGMPLQEAYLNTLKTTGRAVVFTGLTLGVGVATWYFSEVQFQKDMGTLLVFMFIWNMFGAMWLMPALVRFLVKPEKLYPEAYAAAQSQ